MNDLADEIALLKSIIELELDYFNKASAEYREIDRKVFHETDSLRCSLFGLRRELIRAEETAQKLLGGG